MDPIALIRLIESPEFQKGFVVGAFGLGVGLLGRKLKLDWGLLWVPTVLIALIWAGVIDGIDTERVFTKPGWVIAAALLTVTLGSAGLYANRTRPEIGPALAVSVGGLWATVPDTEQVAVLLGATTALLWLWWPRPVLEIRIAGSVSVVCLAVWASSVGAVGREGAYVGAFGALASLALLSVPSRTTSPWWRFAFHVLLVVGWTRLAGLSRSAPNALLLGIAVTVGISALKEAAILVQLRSAGS